MTNNNCKLCCDYYWYTSFKMAVQSADVTATFLLQGGLHGQGVFLRVQAGEGSHRAQSTPRHHLVGGEGDLVLKF